MRFRFFLSAALLGAATACSTNSKPEAEASAATTAAQRRHAIEQLRIPFASPVLLDSSADVLYPLPLHELVTEESGSYSYGSSSYSRQDMYWNILFYNTRSGETHLLDAGRKLVIQAYHIPDAYSTTGDANGASPAKKPARFLAERLIFYSVTLADTNRDGDLTTDDATYLFTSDKAGRDFRQISPDSLHVRDWEIQHATGSILLQTVRDSNRNRKFDDEDEVLPYLYDPATKQSASKLFAPAIIQQLRATFQRSWEKKPKS